MICLIATAAPMSTQAQGTEAAATPATSVPQPLRGDANAGRALYRSRCMACHDIDQDKVGPAHRGVFGRRAGSVPSYEYSSGLKRSNFVWTDANLDRWLADPEAMVPWQQMDFKVSDPQQRADVIAYLKTLR